MGTGIFFFSLFLWEYTNPDKFNLDDPLHLDFHAIEAISVPRSLHHFGCKVHCIARYFVNVLIGVIVLATLKL